MKTNESKFQKCHAALLRHGHTAWMFLRNCGRRHPIGDDVLSNEVREEPSVQRLNPLDRIREHLRRHGLGQQVHVRIDEAGGGFVLEDDDGLVHAKDYDKAVVMIERIWLYQP
jgi:hypothetical protein